MSQDHQTADGPNKRYTSSFPSQPSQPMQSSQPMPYGELKPIAFGLSSDLSRQPFAPDAAADLSSEDQSAPKGRLRVSKACDRCRTQKIKCSGTYPCTTCTKHMKECVYNSASSAAAKAARPSETIGAPTMLNITHEKELPYLTHSDDKNYIRHLENRIQYLESRLSNTASDLARNLRDGEVEDEDSARLLNPTSKWRYSNRYQLLLSLELCKNAYDGLSEENKKKVVLPRQQYFGWNLSGTYYLSPEPLPVLPEFLLPNPVKFYTDYFFKEINILFAIIHESVFVQQLSSYNELMNEMKNEPASAYKDSKANMTRLFEAKLYLIIALAIRFTEFSSKKGPDLEMLKMEEKMFQFSYQIIRILSFEWESFELIQGWLLISLYLRVTHRQSSCYSSLAYAVTMSKAMGLSRKNERHRIPGTKYERLKAKRIFWAVFTLERLFGLQSGRYGLLNEYEIELTYPSYDFEEESQNDTWITLPAFALIHVAKLATYVHTAMYEKLDLVKYQQINKEIVQLNAWMNANGFNNNEIFNNPNEEISSLAKSQVKLNYYDVVLCVHGKVLFNFTGRRIATQGFKIEMVLDSCISIIDVLLKVQKANQLYAPWYLNLLLAFNVGINLLTLISAGLYLTTAREYYSKVVSLLTAYKKVTVKNNDKKVVVKKRFKMAEECLWALKSASKILFLRLEEDLQGLQSMGVDPGSSDVNKQTFTQYGKVSDVQPKAEESPSDNNHQVNQEFYSLFRNGVKKRKMAPEEMAPDASSTTSAGSNEHIPEFTFEPENVNQNPMMQGYGQGQAMYSNLLWFDQWLDDDFSFVAPAPPDIQ